MIFDIFVGVFLALILGGSIFISALWFVMYYSYTRVDKLITETISKSTNNNTGEDLL